MLAMLVMGMMFAASKEMADRKDIRVKSS